MPADDAVAVTDTMVAPQVADIAPGFRMLADVVPEPSKELSGVPLVMASLKAMGFLDEKMIEAAIAKNGEDIESCAADLAAASVAWGFFAVCARAGMLQGVLGGVAVSLVFSRFAAPEQAREKS